MAYSHVILVYVSHCLGRIVLVIHAVMMYGADGVLETSEGE